MKCNVSVLMVALIVLLFCILTGWQLKHYEPIQQIGEAIGIDMTVRNTCMLLNLLSIEYERTPAYVAMVAVAYARAVSSLKDEFLIWLYSRLGHIFVAALSALAVELFWLLRPRESVI